jgi:elongation factor 1-alpha
MAKPHINLVVVGHVDHGKSTLVGRLLYEKGVLSEQVIQKFKKESEELGKQTFEFAYAMDITKEERKRGLTIDLAHRKFDTDNYSFTIIDAPGHKDFIKNMITGASQADAGVLVIAVNDGIMPQTKEHAYLSKVLGVKQLVIAVNKMDMVKYDQTKFDNLKKDIENLLKSIGYDPSKVPIIPTSAYKGDNITKKSDNIKWYEGKTLLETLDAFEAPELPTELPLRLPLQDVYSITGIGTVPVGRIETGVMKVGDKVTFQPSNASGEIKSIEAHHESIQDAKPGDNVGFNVRGVDKKQIKRGDVMGHADKPPTVAKEFTAQILVLNHPTAITAGYTPVLHAHTAQVPCKVTKVVKKMDPRTGAEIKDNPDVIKVGDAAIVQMEPQKPLVIEKKDEIPQLASFAIRDMGLTVGAGVVIEIVPK